MQLAGTSATQSTAAVAAATPKPSATAVAYSASISGSSSSAALLRPPSYGRYISHTTSSLSPPASVAAVSATQTLNSATQRPWIFNPPAAAAPAALEDALAASLRSAAAANANCSSAVTTAAKRPGFIATAGIIFRQDGVSGFTRGIHASAARAVANGGIRLGLYDPIKTLMSHDGSGKDLHVGQKLAAGSISGGIGAVLTTPMELCKTRLQVRPCMLQLMLWSVQQILLLMEGCSDTAT